MGGGRSLCVGFGETCKETGAGEWGRHCWRGSLGSGGRKDGCPSVVVLVPERDRSPLPELFQLRTISLVIIGGGL